MPRCTEHGVWRCAITRGLFAMVLMLGTVAAAIGAVGAA
jgi:hypothetical protein